MDQSISLREATVQEIQFELIRRTRFNAMDGQQVYDSLLKHRSLWLAVLLNRPRVPNYAEPRLLLTSILIKLLDLPYNICNTNTLFILTRSPHEIVMDVTVDYGPQMTKSGPSGVKTFSSGCDRRALAGPDPPGSRGILEPPSTL